MYSVKIVDMGRELKNKDHFKNIVKRDLVVYVVHSDKPFESLGIDINTLNPDKLFVFIYGNIQGGTTSSKSDITINGETIILNGGQCDRFIPNKTEQGLYTKLIYDDNRTLLAGVIRNAIVIFFDLTHSDNRIRDLFAYIVKKSIPHLNLKGIKIKTHSEDELKKLLTSMMEKQIVEELKALKKSKEELKKVVKTTSDDMVSGIRKLKICETQLEAMKTMEKDTGKSIKRELEAIFKNPKVDKVHSSMGKIYITLKPIKLGRHDMGKYTIEISGNHIERITTNKAHGEFQHPHIKNNGRDICWGNYKGIIELMANYQLATVVNLITNFLSTWNKADRYITLSRLIAYWKEHNPKAKPKPIPTSISMMRGEMMKTIGTTTSV